MINRKDRDNAYDVTKGILNTIRANNSSKAWLKEAVESNEEKDDEESIAITDDPRFGENVLQNQKDSFKSTVNGGARFAKDNPDDPESNPLVFFPKTGNLVFSGTIPNLSDLKFQYSLNDVTGAPYIFVEGLALTDDVITTLNKMNGHYKNWRDEWLASGDLLDKLKEKKD